MRSAHGTDTPHSPPPPTHTHKHTCTYKHYITISIQLHSVALEGFLLPGHRAHWERAGGDDQYVFHCDMNKEGRGWRECVWVCVCVWVCCVGVCGGVCVCVCVFPHWSASGHLVEPV